MSRRGFALAFVLAGFAAMGLSAYAGHALVALGLILLSREAYAAIFRAMYGGYPLNRPSCLENACYEAGEEGFCGYVGFEVEDCKHGCYDLDEKEFWARSNALFNMIFAAGGAYFFVVRSGGLYVVVKKCAERKWRLAGELKRAAEALERAMELAGCRLRRLSGPAVLEALAPPRLEEVKPSPLRVYGIPAALALLSARLPFLAPLAFLAFVALTARRGRFYAVRTDGRLGVYGLVGCPASFAYPSLREIFAKARANYSTVSSVAYLALRLEPATWDVAAQIDSQAYRTYEIGTALDKLSTIHQSQKLFQAARRRWERREPVFVVDGILVGAPDVRSLYERMGLLFAETPFALKALK